MVSLLLAVLLCFPAIAWAEMTVIYRKADRTVASYVAPGQSVQQELTNLTKSELGGKVSDYAIVTVDTLRPGEEVTVDAQGEATKVRPVNPQPAAEARIRAKLGLTPAEFQDLRNAVR